MNISQLHADYPSNQYTELRTLQAYHCAQFISKMTRPGDAVILCGDFNHTDTEIGIRSMKAITRLKDSWRTALDKVNLIQMTLHHILISVFKGFIASQCRAMQIKTPYIGLLLLFQSSSIKRGFMLSPEMRNSFLKQQQYVSA